MSALETPAVRQALSRANFSLMTGHPFFASILLTMPLIVTEDLPFKTMAVDGKNLYADPGFVAAQSKDHLMGVLVHEALHVVLKHHLRRGARCPKRWNIAADWVVNPIVVDSGLRLPDFAIFNPASKGMSTEQAYELVTDEMVDRLYPSVLQLGAVLDLSDLSDAERAEVEKKLERAVRAAAQAAHAAGKLPGSLSSLVEAQFEHKVKWTERLRHGMGGLGFDDWTWAKPDRGFLGVYGTVLPSVRGYRAGTVVAVVDSSCSVTDEEASHYLAEINGVIRECRPETVLLMMCDTKVQSVEEIEDEMPAVTVLGRGGTDFKPPFEWLEEQGIQPDALIYLTDLEGPFPLDPGFPVFWCTLGTREAPFGETIRIED